MSNDQHLFAAHLLLRRVITPDQLVEAWQAAGTTGALLDQVLVRLGHASALDVQKTWAEVLGLPFLDVASLDLPQAVVELLPESVARENCVLAVAQEGRTIVVAMANPAEANVLEKLEFILNRPLRPVVALREALLEAIDRYYGQSETESVDSMLVEFTDTAIDFTETGRSLDLEEAESDVAPAPARRLEQRATVRYFHRMCPERMFPLLVVLSREEVMAVARRGARQAQSETFQVTEGSVVEVEPVVPGCACYPPKEQVRIGPGEVSLTFWVVPHVLGKVMHARVVVRQEGAPLAEVPLEVCVTRQSATVLVGALSFVLPFVLLLLKHFHLDFETQMQEGFGLYAQLAGWLVHTLTPEVLTGMLLAATGGLYLWLRPRSREVFWDVNLASRASREEPALSSALPAPGRATEAGNSDLLAAADERYEEGDFAAALALYERSWGVPASAKHSFRASLAAFELGDTRRALEILRKAEASLPAEAMKGPLWYNMGCFAARLGQFPDAVHYLACAVDAGLDDPRKYLDDPDLEPLRWHAGFKALLAQMAQ